MEIHFGEPVQLDESLHQAQPILALRMVRDAGFFYPVNAGDVDATQTLLNHTVENELGRKAEPGIVTQVVWWDGIFCTVGAFDPQSGQQVGLGQALWDPDPRGRERSQRIVGYRTSFIVASQYEGLGYATIMRFQVENFISTHLRGFGAYFLSHVQAVSQESKEAAEAIMRRFGALPAPDSHPGWYIKFVPRTEAASIGQSIKFHHLLLTQREQKLTLPQGMTVEDDSFFFGDTQIAQMRKGAINFIGGSELSDLKFALWTEAKRAGYRIDFLT